MLFAIKLNKTLLQRLKIVKLEMSQPLIIKIEEEVFLMKPVSYLLHQHRFTTTTYARNNKYFGGFKPFVSYMTLYIMRSRSMQGFMLFEHYLLK